MIDHVWTLREVLLWRVPLWPQPQTVGSRARADMYGAERLTCARMQAQKGEGHDSEGTGEVRNIYLQPAGIRPAVLARMW